MRPWPPMGEPYGSPIDADTIQPVYFHGSTCWYNVTNNLGSYTLSLLVDYKLSNPILKFSLGIIVVSYYLLCQLLPSLVTDKCASFSDVRNEAHCEAHYMRIVIRYRCIWWQYKTHSNSCLLKNYRRRTKTCHVMCSYSS